MSELKASRELDAMVAEKIMGDVAWDVVIEGCSRGGRACATLAEAERYREGLSRHYHVGGIVLHDSVPAYSTSIADAWEVLEKMISGGWQMSIETGQFGGFVTGFWRVAQDQGTHRIYEALGDTAPLAICLAALAALKSVSPDPQRSDV